MPSRRRGFWTAAQGSHRLFTATWRPRHARGELTSVNQTGRRTKRPAGATHPPVINSAQEAVSQVATHARTLQQRVRERTRIDCMTWLSKIAISVGLGRAAPRRYDRCNPFLRTKRLFRHNRYHSHNPYHRHDRYHRCDRNLVATRDIEVGCNCSERNHQVWLCRLCRRERLQRLARH